MPLQYSFIAHFFTNAWTFTIPSPNNSLSIDNRVFYLFISFDTMKFSATAIITVAFTSFATATLHYNALCVDHVAGQNVYNDKATRAACGNYFMRNTGGEQWDTCPDCGMVG